MWGVQGCGKKLGNQNKSLARRNYPLCALSRHSILQISVLLVLQELMLDIIQTYIKDIKQVNKVQQYISAKQYKDTF